MEQRLEKLETKIEHMLDIQSIIRADLQEHMRRTEVAEENIKNISAAIQPIQHHVAFVSGLGKLLTILGTVFGALGALWQAYISRR